MFLHLHSTVGRVLAIEPVVDAVFDFDVVFDVEHQIRVFKILITSLGLMWVGFL